LPSPDAAGAQRGMLAHGFFYRLYEREPSFMELVMIGVGKIGFNMATRFIGNLYE
jgi:hypothetical protein